jgi:hypothetical protein
MGKRVGKELGDDRTHGSPFPLLQGLDLSQDRILDVDRRPHDA